MNKEEKEQIKKNIYKYYDYTFSCRSDRHIRMQEVLPEITKDSCVLDYGCGLGCISHFFANKFNCNIDAIDISIAEIEKAKLAWEENNINFIAVSDFDFPTEKYDLCFSSQVIEHVHNAGNYLSKINQMLKYEGHLVIGLPNIINFNFILGTFFSSNKTLVRHSKEVLDNYDKVHGHVNAWDPYTFVTLLASCGFEMEQYLPTEGMAMPAFIWKRIPLIGKYLPAYINKMNRGYSGNLSYTMFFRFRKVKNVFIDTND
jgi:2-polyprenyl-3-methyl-5-hydroxy-6-metoxy-1,4-benzoquinol methylase